MRGDTMEYKVANGPAVLGYALKPASPDTTAAIEALLA